jgi:hypothetical protein
MRPLPPPDQQELILRNDKQAILPPARANVPSVSLNNPIQRRSPSWRANLEGQLPGGLAQGDGPKPWLVDAGVDDQGIFRITPRSRTIFTLEKDERERTSARFQS